MTYLSNSEYLARFGDAETIRLTDEDRTGAVDTAKLEAEITHATEEANSYLGKRYTVPLEDPPQLIKGIVGTLARERLHRAAGMTTSQALEKDAELARSQLRDLARAVMTLPTATGIATEDARPAADSASSGDAVEPIFSRENLDAFGVSGVSRVARWRQ